MKPLTGVKILDFTQFMAGPHCTRMLSDLGAEVIKLENPPMGDASRFNKDIVDSKSTNWTTRNRGKKSVLMDLRDERQKALFLKMLETADAVVENFKPGTLDKLGVTYDLMKEINPRIVFTSISGYGQTGPYRDHAAYDSAVQGEGGLISITGEVGGTPVRCGALIADATGGLLGCIGTLAALYDAKRTGMGRRVDVSMMDGIVFLMDNFISSYLTSGTMAKPAGNLMWTAAPFREFTCRDGNMVFIGIGTDPQFVKFAKIVGHTEWLEDPRFTTIDLRVNNRDIMEGLVQKVLEEEFDAPALCEAMQAEGLVYGSINNVAQVTQHPQVAARNMIVNAMYGDGINLQVTGCPIKISGYEEATDIHADTLGEHTFEVLSEYLEEGSLHAIYDNVFEKCNEVLTAKYSAK
ncbi:MAG: CoA transferase [Clostridiales bacterium]|nr:CoA transferase [Clostridiales bacterium]